MIGILTIIEQNTNSRRRMYARMVMGVCICIYLLWMSPLFAHCITAKKCGDIVRALLLLLFHKEFVNREPNVPRSCICSQH